MSREYKYKLEDYKNYSLLYSDMKDFYDKLETNKNSPTKSTEFDLTESLHMLHFSIKHRTVEGYLTTEEREEMWSYFWGLVYD